MTFQNQEKEKSKNKGGRPPSSIWEDIIRGESVGSGKFRATCKFCETTWSRGDVSKLEEHLSNHCSAAPASVVRKYLSKILEREDNNNLNKKRKLAESTQLTMTSFHDSVNLPNSRITRVNRALAKCFVACGLSFRIVEHPFFINLVKELNAGYELPTRNLVSDHLLERELASVNSKVKADVENEKNLTLVFDGWTSPTNRSIWSFIIMTPSRKEYLFKLEDLSENSHTGEYLAEVIGGVIEKIGPNKISAMVSDNASNVRLAREILQQKYPNIENVRCIAHSINLIACDIVKEPFGDRLLRRVNTLASFFKSSHRAGAQLTKLIKENGIDGGGIKLYCKTRWTTASESVDSVIKLESVLEEIVSTDDHLLSDKAKRVILSRNFFSDLRILSFVLDPLRKAVLALESRTATLGDCFLSLIRLSAVLKKLPRSFNQTFRNHCFNVMNERFKEFDDDKYLTCFFLNPRFRDKPLTRKAFARIVRCATTIGKRLGFDLDESRALCEQIKNYKDFKEPFDLDVTCALDDPRNWWNLIDTEPRPDSLPRLARHLLAICPNSASCERGFSTLGWLFNKRRLNLSLERLESMGKMIMFWKSNAKTELGFYGFDQKNKTRLSEADLNINIAEAFAEAFAEAEEDDDEYEELLNEKSTEPSSARQTIDGEPVPRDDCIVLIEHIWIDKYVDLSHNLIVNEVGEVPVDVMDDDESDGYSSNEENESSKDDNDREKGVLNYDVEDLLSEFISE